MQHAGYRSWRVVEFRMSNSDGTGNTGPLGNVQPARPGGNQNPGGGGNCGLLNGPFCSPLGRAD
jgi:hypothetical protein